MRYSLREKGLYEKSFGMGWFSAWYAVGTLGRLRPHLQEEGRLKEGTQCVLRPPPLVESRRLRLRRQLWQGAWMLFRLWLKNDVALHLRKAIKFGKQIATDTEQLRERLQRMNTSFRSDVLVESEFNKRPDTSRWMRTQAPYRLYENCPEFNCRLSK